MLKSCQMESMLATQEMASEHGLHQNYLHFSVIHQRGCDKSWQTLEFLGSRTRKVKAPLGAISYPSHLENTVGVCQRKQWRWVWPTSSPEDNLLSVWNSCGGEHQKVCMLCHKPPKSKVHYAAVVLYKCFIVEDK